MTYTTQSTMQTYLSALLPFFTFLEQACGSYGPWDGSPSEVHHAVEMYLLHALQCKVKSHRLGFQIVSTTGGTTGNIRMFLSGLKLFYRIMCQEGRYVHPHPLLEMTFLHAMALAEEPVSLPHMPAISGVVAPSPNTTLLVSLKLILLKAAGKPIVHSLTTKKRFPSVGL